jgi:hypothetical protein
MPQDFPAVLDTIFVHLSLAYCTHLLIKAVLLIHRETIRFRRSYTWKPSFISQQRASSETEYDTPIQSNRRHSLADYQLPLVLQHPPLPLQSKVFIAGRLSKLSESETTLSSETSVQIQKPRIQTRPAIELWDDAACETDADLAKQAFRNMVRARRESSHQWLQARLAERRRPSYSLFGLRWPFS